MYLFCYYLQFYYAKQIKSNCIISQLTCHTLKQDSILHSITFVTSSGIKQHLKKETSRETRESVGKGIKMDVFLLQCKYIN